MQKATGNDWLIGTLLAWAFLICIVPTESMKPGIVSGVVTLLLALFIAGIFLGGPKEQ